MVTTPLKRGLTVAAAIAAAVFTAACGDDENSGQKPKVGANGIPQVSVKFAHEPYFDHTQSSIAFKKGWFKEVGVSIEPDDKGIVADGDDAIAVFASNRVDVISASAQLFMPAVAKLPSYKLFAISDTFQGYGLMAKPEFKSYEEIKSSGVPSDQAFQQAIGQMRGKRFCFPSEAAIKGFIQLVLKTGGMSQSDTKATVAGDSQTTSLMRSGRCDFQVGGVPSRLNLELAGFKPIVTSGDLAASAKPSAQSQELQAVFNDGWVASDKWLEANHETALRLISVNLRINQFINDHPEEAAAIHTPFLNSVAGTKFKPELAQKVVYPSLDPFLTLEDQQKVCYDDQNPMNPKYLIGSAIELYKSQGVFKGSERQASDFSNACELLSEMLKLKKRTEAALAKAGDSAEAAQAKKYYDAYDYLDSARLAEQAASGS
jgi:ABC-type nitrate/sulfonate/bicarbonate transport system substrate-binding protein